MGEVVVGLYGTHDFSLKAIVTQLGIVSLLQPLKVYFRLRGAQLSLRNFSISKEGESFRERPTWAP